MGKDAQQQIRKARVLIVGMGSVSAELGKNLTLSGFGHITVMDDQKVGPADLGANFLLPADSVGQMRATVSVASLAELNPMVVLEDRVEGLDSLTPSQIKEYKVVCASELSAAGEMKLDEQCREAGVPLLSSRSFGYGGFLFMDLMDVRYKCDKKTKEGQPPVHESLSYPSLASVYASPWKAIKRPKKFSKFWFAVNAMHRLELDGVDLASSEAVEAALGGLTESLGLDAAILPLDELKRVIKHKGVEVSAVSAVMGGMIGQEVVKVISGTGRPVYNYFMFDSHTGVGVVEAVAV